MEEGAVAWSGLGSGMNLPSTLKDEMDKLKLELRDLKLDVAKDLMELKDTVSSVIGDMVSIIDKQKSLLTRVEGLETRAQGSPVMAHSQNDPFNAFAYATLDELEDSNSVNEEVHETDIDEKQPASTVGAEGNSSNKDSEEVRTLSDEDVAAEFLVKVGDHIDEVGGVLNNILYTKLWKEDEPASSGIKKLVKAGLLADETIELHKLSKLRGLYYRTGGDPTEIYKELYG